MERRQIKKQLAAKHVDVDEPFYIVSDYGYEDCGYQGPYTYNEVCKEWKALRGRDADYYDFVARDGMHYITQESWKLKQIDDRSRSEWR
jgi:hypothetical protein